MKRTLLIIGGIVAGLVLALVITWILYQPANRVGWDEDSVGSRVLVGEGAAPAMVEEVVVEVEKAMEAPAAEPVAYDTMGTAYAAERLIIRTGNISMDVKDTRAALESIEAMVAGMAPDGAFVVSAQEYGGTGEGSQPHISVSIRIPVTRFDETMDRLADLAVNVSSRSESAEDVTEEYVDLEARLESLETARLRLLGIMEEARSTKDLLEAEQQLTQREAEIESIKGRMQYLEQSARLSSIWIELEPYILSQPVGDEWRPVETARRAVESLVDGLRGLGDFMIFFAIAILPWLVLIGIVVIVIVLLVRRRARSRKPATTGE